MNNGILKTAGLTTIIFLYSCNAFMHGYTEKKTLDTYHLVTGDKDNFGDRRIKYNQGFHHKSALDNFLKYKGIPDLIYEYKTPTKQRGIKLFYIKIDSAFIFEEPKRGNLNSVLKEARKMDEYEKLTYERLKQ